jgi:HD-GYP domain-containing protein (c-di-GMP phosphodiesterase class II)/ligand-binding sensor domain-containing protein
MHAIRAAPRRPGRQLLSWLVAATLGGAAAAGALDPERGLDELVVDHWTTERGLPQNSVNALLETRDGYLWIATFGGLARFDGVRFRVFDGEEGNGLPSSRILSLFEDRAGRLWVGTQDGGVALRDGDRFVDPLPEALPSAVVWTIAEDREGGIWIGTEAGVVRFADGRLERFGAEQGLPGHWVRDLAVDAEGTLWAATDGGVARFAAGRFEPRAAGGFWSLAPAAGLAGGELRTIELEDGAVRFERGPAGSGPFARELYVDRAGTVWIGGERLARWRPGAVLLDVDSTGRVVGPIRTITEDREGGLWVGSDGGGLFRLRAGAARAFGREAGLTGDSALPIVEDSRGRLWVGTLCGGVVLARGETFAPVEDPMPRDGPPCIRSLAAGRDGALWVGSLGLARLDDEGWQSVASGALVGTVHALVEDRYGTLWIASDRGLFRRRGDGVVTRVTGAPGVTYWSLLARRDGSFAAGGAGLVLPLGADGTPGEAIELGGARPSVAVRDLWEAPGGALWAATYGAGVARVDGSGAVAWVSVAQGLEEPFVSRLLDDGRGSLWLTGNRGIYRVRPEELEAAAAGRGRVAPRRLDTGDGMRVAETNGGGSPAGWRARDGRLWFPTVQGVAVVDPGRVEAKPAPPLVHVEELSVDGRERGSGGADLAGAERIELRYTALGLTRPDRVRFRHRLVGYDSGWQFAGDRRFAVYTRLPAGQYRFEVVAANEGGVWSPEPATLAFVVPARWYETFSFRAAAALAALAGLRGIYRLRSRGLRRRKAELEVVVAERTAELARLNENLERLVVEQTGEIRDTRDQAILTLARLAELRDGTTGEHLDRIALYSRRLTTAIADGPFGPLGPDFVEEIFRSSPLHDIGKVAIPDAILTKPGPLDAAERAVMESHTTIGGDTLRGVIERSRVHSFLSMGMAIAYAHHERWDGGGYPRRLAGEAIPLAARIVALVDAYDAITAPRPYKPGHEHGEAVRRILSDAGRHFDPRLVEAFRRIHEDLDRLRRDHATTVG